MKNALARLKLRLGRRGATLLVLAFAFALIGFKALSSPSEDVGHFVLYALLPTIPRVILWLVPAILATVAAFRPVGRDGFGFAALCIPAMVLTFSYVWSFVAFLFHATDYPFGFVSAAMWLAILGFVLIVSGWPEVTSDHTIRTARQRHKRSRHSADS